MAYLGRSIERDMYYGAKPELFRLAEGLRKNATIAEKTLWKWLKQFRCEGFVFRRQHPLDFFIADFYCDKIKLVIEVDGDIHLSEKNIEYDDNRTGELERFGLKVIRFKNEKIINDPEQVISEIKILITELSSPALLGAGDRRG